MIAKFFAAIVGTGAGIAAAAITIVVRPDAFVPPENPAAGRSGCRGILSGANGRATDVLAVSAPTSGPLRSDYCVEPPALGFTLKRSACSSLIG